jgi:hypothetical protein
MCAPTARRPQGSSESRRRTSASSSWCPPRSTACRCPTRDADRTYKIAEDHGAVRLVFRRGLEYWGVQQTNWADAPVLDSKNLRRVVNGRAYDLYYRGPKLHMVVLKQNGASYWVVNTLLDSLSNETMLAIAKGLQPLDPPKKPKKLKKTKAKKAAASR